MNQNWQERVDAFCGAVDLVNLGANDSLKNRVDRFEVRRVRCESDTDGCAVWSGEGALCAQVILDVTGTLNGLGVDVALELAENLRVGLAGDVGEHVEATTVSHADVDFSKSGVGSCLQDCV